MRISKFSYCILLLALICWSCTSDIAEYDESYLGGDVTLSKDAYITLSISIPTISTRAVQDDSEDSLSEDQTSADEDYETYLHQVDVLVFELRSDGMEYYSYATDAVKINNSSTGLRSFEAKIKQSQSDEKYRLVVIANAHHTVRSVLDKLVEGAEITKPELLYKLQYERTLNWDIKKQGLPMWGETLNAHHISPTTNGAELGVIRMLRAMARVDVYQHQNLKDFALDNILVYNVPKHLLVAPLFKENNGQLEQIKPSLISQSENDKPTNVLDSKYDVVADAEGHRLLTRAVYLSEAINTDVERDKKLCLVVQGRYMDETTGGFYRVDFLDESGLPRDIYRNHLYCMYITSVKGAGANTPEEALENVEANIEVSVVDWDIDTIGDLVFDGEHFLSINPKEISVGKEGVSLLQPERLTIKTDMKDALSYEIFNNTNTSPVNPDTHWFKVINTPQNSTSHADTYYLNYWVKPSFILDNRTCHIRILVGDRLTAVVKVTQSYKPKVSLKIERIFDDKQPEELHQAYFVGSSETETLKFRVSWTPASADLYLLEDIIESNTYAVPPIDWIKGLTPGTISGKTHKGVVEFEVQPALLGSDKYKGNRFMFYINTEYGKEIKPLEFIQAKPFIEFEAPKTMVLDGREHYSVVVKSSVPWKLINKRNDFSRVGPIAFDNYITGQVAPLINRVAAKRLTGSISETPQTIIADGQPNLPNGTIVPIVTRSDYTWTDWGNADGQMQAFAGVLELEVQTRSSDIFIGTTKSILCTAGVDQTNREANCYVLPKKNRGKGILIPIKAANLEQHDVYSSNAPLSTVNLNLTNWNKVIGADTKVKPTLIWMEHNLLSVPSPSITKRNYGYINDLINEDASLIFEYDKSLIRGLAVIGTGKDAYLLVLPGNTALGDNAVVGITDANGNVLWSWHIWFSDIEYENNKPLETILKPFSGTPWLRRDLGAVTDLSYGTYYQWGRKDPFPPVNPTSTNGLLKNTYTLNAGKSGFVAVEHFVSSKSVSFDETLKKPEKMFFGVSHWFNGTIMGLRKTVSFDFWWGATDSSGIMDKKTVFDPCPAGYRVPGENRSVYFSNTSYNNTDGSIKDKNGVIYPLAGYLDASLKYVKQFKLQGYRWYGGQLNSEGYYQKWTTISSERLTRVKQNGHTIRCVKANNFTPTYWY